MGQTTNHDSTKRELAVDGGMIEAASWMAA